MTYLTYGEYSNMGGTLDIAAFDHNISRVCGIIDNATHRRIEKMKQIPTQAKDLCRDLIDFVATNNNVNEKHVASRSESQGPVSESVSYVTKSKQEVQSDIDEIVFDYLASVTDDFGTPLLYRGCGR